MQNLEILTANTPRVVDNHSKSLDDVLKEFRASMLEIKAEEAQAKAGTIQEVESSKACEYKSPIEANSAENNLAEEAQAKAGTIQEVESSKACEYKSPIEANSAENNLPDVYELSSESGQTTHENHNKLQSESIAEPDLNGSQTVHKNGATVHLSPEVIHKRYSQPASNSTQNLSQTVHERYSKPISNGSQTVHENGETVHERYSEPITNGSQTVHDYQNFSSLPLVQKNLLKALHNNAQINGNRTTQKLSLSSIADMAQIRTKSIKNTIWKLKNKKLLTTKEYRDGRGGWVVYEIPKDVFLDILNFENGSRTVHEQCSQPISQPTSDPLYNNSNNNINTIIIKPTLPAEWEEIDITPLADMGLSKKHVLALYGSNNLTADAVQESINSYAWGLKNNPEPYKKYKNHLCGLLGVLKKGDAWIESGYVSPTDLLCREMNERKRKKEAEREKRINELVELEFPDWERGLSREQISAIAPRSMKLDPDVVQTLLKSHFKKEVLLTKIKKEAQLMQSGASGNFQQGKNL